MSFRPSLQVAVVMRRERVPGAMSRWQTWRWVLHDVLGHDLAPHAEHFGTEPRCLRHTDDEQLWLHPGFTVELFRDDAEGYYLNATTPAPCWFVLWRMEEEPGLSDEVMAVPTMVSVSYHDAGRWLDAQENVDPLAPELVRNSRRESFAVGRVLGVGDDKFDILLLLYLREKFFYRMPARFADYIADE